MTTTSNLTTRLLGYEEPFFLLWEKECWPITGRSNQLAKELSEQKFYGSTFACIFCIFPTLPWWKQHIFRCTGLLSTLYGRNTSSLPSFTLLKSEGKRKQTGRKYSVHCSVRKVTPDHRPAFQFHYLVHPLTS